MPLLHSAKPAPSPARPAVLSRVRLSAGRRLCDNALLLHHRLFRNRLMKFDQILTGDCLHHLAKMPAACVDLAFADPPFNIGYDYDVYNDRRRREDYLAWAERWLSAVRRVLKPTGSVFVAI